MKTKLTKDQTRVAQHLLGKRDRMTLLQATNTLDFLGRHQLKPVAMEVDGKLHAFDKTEFRRAVREGQRLKDDTYCRPYYDARDCAAVTGSPAPNWTSWTRVLFDITDPASNPHPDYIVLSARNPDHAEVREGILASGRPCNATPILSATAVAFYFAAQKSWPDPKRYFHVVEPIKRLLAKNNIEVLGLGKADPKTLPPDDASDIDVDKLLQGVPADPATTSAVDTLAVSDVAEDGDVADLLDPQPDPAPTTTPDNGSDIAQATVPLGVPGARRLAEMDDAEFEAYQQEVTAALAEAAARRQEAKRQAVWESGKVVDRKRWPGRPYDCSVTVEYSDGTRKVFTDPKWEAAQAEGRRTMAVGDPDPAHDHLR
jgi:hypothetical protein